MDICLEARQGWNSIWEGSVSVGFRRWRKRQMSLKIDMAFLKLTKRHFVVETWDLNERYLIMCCSHQLHFWKAAQWIRILLLWGKAAVSVICVLNMAQTNITIQILAETNLEFPVRAGGEQTHCIIVSACRGAGACVANAVDTKLKDRNTSKGRQSYRFLALLVEWTQEQSNAPPEGLPLNILLPTQLFSKKHNIILFCTKRDLGFDNILPSWQCCASYSCVEAHNRNLNYRR